MIPELLSQVSAVTNPDVCVVLMKPYKEPKGA